MPLRGRAGISRTGGSPRVIAGLKALEYLGLALFTILVPRSMGPEAFGSFAAVLAVVGLMIASTGLGAFMTFGRFVPEYLESDDEDAIRRLFTQLLAVRIAMAVGLGVAVVGAVLVLVPEVGLGGAFLAAVAFCAGAVGTAGYQLLYGLNRLDLSIVRDAFGRVTLVAAIVLAGKSVSPLTAVALLAATEVLLASFALITCLPWLQLEALRSDMTEVTSALRFGAAFFGASLLLTSIWRGGEVTVAAMSIDRSEIGFYSLASAMAMAAAGLLSQVSSLLLPSATRLYVRGEEERFEAWMATSVRYVTLLAGLGAVAAFSFADVLLPVMLGPGFERVAPNLKVLALGLIPLGLIRTATSIAVVKKEARQIALVGVEGFVTFLVVVVLLVPRIGSLGASAAVAAAFGVAGARALSRMGLQAIANRGRLPRTVALTGVLVIFAIPGIGHWVASALAIVLFVASAFGLGIVSLRELHQGFGALMGRTQSEAGPVVFKEGRP